MVVCGLVLVWCSEGMTGRAGLQADRGRGEGGRAARLSITIQAIQAMEAAWRYGVLVLGWRV